MPFPMPQAQRSGERDGGWLSRTAVRPIPDGRGTGPPSRPRNAHTGTKISHGHSPAGHSTRSHRDEERAFSAICWRYGNSISSRLYPQSLSSLASRETGGEVSQRAGRGARLPHRVAPVLEPMNRCGYSFRQNLRKVQLEGSKPELKRMDGWMDKWMDG